MSLTASLQAALQFHQTGQWAQAEAIYHDLLHRQAHCADAWHLLGDIALRRRDIKRAVVLVMRAIGANPKVGAYYVTLGRAYQAMGELEQAVACLERAVDLKQTELETVAPHAAHAAVPKLTRIAWR